MSTDKLSRLLQRKLRKFTRLKRQLARRKTAPGDFRASRYQNYLVARLQKLQKQIVDVNGILRAATVAGALTLAANGAHAQIPLPGFGPNTLGPFTLSDRAHNPLRPGIYNDIQFKPTAVDLDKDGDLDLVLGTYGDGHNGVYRYFRNDGTSTSAQLVELIDNQNPFNYVTGWSSPAFADLDKDGDLDMFVGEEQNDAASPTYGSIHYFVNKNGQFWSETTPGNFEANEQKGPWNPVTKAGNPANLLIFKTHVMPTFVDLDKDGDDDLIVSTDFDAEPTAVSYFLNDSNGNLSVSDFHPYTTWFNEDLNFGDIDNDGDLDFVFGDIDGDIHFFSNNGSGIFIEQTGTWNAAARTGSPFNGLTPHDFNGSWFETTLTLGDFNGDGFVDAMVGFRSGSSPYFTPTAPYFLRNNGQGNLERVDNLLDPLGGVEVFGVATVDFQDIDNDGQLDAIVSGSGNTTVDLYLADNNTFIKAPNTSSPFGTSHLGNLYDGAAGQLIDFDGDNDLDFVSSTYYGKILYFKNVNGNYTPQPNDTTNPFNTDDLNSYEGDFGPVVLAFVDIDNDHDLDLFIGEKYGYVDYFRNDDGVLNKQGLRDASSHAPLDDLNPLGDVLTPQPYYGGKNPANIRFADLDHDGDYDALVGHSAASLDSDGFNVAPESILYYENTGTAQVPVFQQRGSPFNDNDLGEEPLLRFIDFDKDGDLDAFMGYQEDNGYNQLGRFKYFVNTNPAPVVASNIVTIAGQPGTNIVVDANLGLTDQDNDVIVGAEIAIQNFEPGKDQLVFTPSGPITGTFNTSTGKLMLTGRGTIADYTSVLRTVAYRFVGTKPASGGRKGSKTIAVTKNITIAATDADQTLATAKAIAIQISFPNSTPVVTTSGAPSKYLNAPVTIDKNVTVADADDATIASATVKVTNFLQQEDVLEFSAQNGITGTFNSSTGILSLTGTSSVSNYQAALRTITYKNSGKSATQGNRVVEFQVFDGETNSNTATASVSIEGDIVVYNALSPNGDNLNPIFLIQNINVLEPANHVSIFDRWGAKVYDTRDYDNSARVFTGHSSNGSELPNGVYFYRIEFLGTSGRAAMEGFLSIRR